ncbi:hypothetical protein NW760_010826 [Fusarium oxysporum]|nr:hypothetical protein NW769_009841 [Fusarium oxysporum]KAJ4223140.1 hypothetical protein NW760_010826 [Fusarium oxysporum]
MATGLPVRWAEFMDYALVYSATAKQNRRIEDYATSGKGRWAIQAILTLSGRYTELEEQYAEIRRSWLRWENTTITRIQEAVTDSRQSDV